MASTTFPPGVLDRAQRPPPSAISALILVVFLVGLAAGVAGFALLALGNETWARALFVGDLVAMLGSVSLGAFAPRSADRIRR
jgi:hypothetical protein